MKKNGIVLSSGTPSFLQKLILVMKLTFALVLIGCLHASAGVYSQSRISVDFQSVQLKKALAVIEKKSNYRFVYRENLVSDAPRVTLTMNDAEVMEVLNNILSNTGLTWQLMGSNLVVLKTGNTILAEVQVTGKVTSGTGEPIAGASVKVKGSTLGVATESDGTYAITVPDDAVLVISSVGFVTTEVSVNGRTTIDVVLQTSETSLDQVVVVGYGTLRRSQVVGSVAKVNGSELTKQPVLTAAQGLQGKAAGIQVISSGAPGSQPQVRIRGTNTVSGNANPVYVVDGVITEDIVSINTADIESVEVLKDAASQAIYGSRAANGVVLITTKKGRSGKMKIDLNSYVGVKSMTSEVKMADAKTYAQYTNEARGYDNQVPMFDLDTLQYDTDWFDISTRNGIIQNHSLSLSGGTEKTTYYFSAGYFNDEGIVRNENYERANFRLNNSYKIAPFLEFGHNVNMSIARANNKPGPFNDAYRNAPTTPVRFPNGDYGLLVGLSVANPIKANELTNNTSKGRRLQGDAYIVLKPVNHLSIRSSISFNRNDYDNLTYNYAYQPISIGNDNPSNLSVGNGNSLYTNFDNNATYRRTFAEVHEIIATAGYSAERSRGISYSASGDSVPVEPNLWYLAYANPNSIEATTGGSLVQRASFYSRLTYTYDDRYNLSGVLRRDGSSNFPANNKWGTFYSIGASWIISREKFMDNQRIFDELRVRAGYGKLGNDRVPGGSLANVNPVSQAGNYWFGGNGYPIIPGITINQLRDASVSWEETRGVDVGIEFSTLNRRLTGEATYYNKVSNVYIPVTLVALAGDNDNSVFSKAADVRNKGVELNLNWKDKVSNSFSYHAGFNITFNRNNIEDVKGALQLRGGSLGNGEVVTYTVENHEIGSFWVYDVVGIFKTQEEVDATSAKITGTKPGDFQYRDVNKDGIINDLDRVFVGSYQPRTYFGLNAGFNWKQLDFSVDCYGNTGNKIYNGKKAIRLGNDNIEAARAEDRWTPDNTNGTQPRASNTIPKPSSYYVESGDFFRINNITLGYSLPARNWNIGMSNLRIFAAAQNPLILKKYSGFTPELPGGNNGLSSGIELSIYPVSTTYMVGVNVSF